MTEVAALYREGRERTAELVQDEPVDRLAAAVPACPEWTVKDVVAHLSGVCADIINGNIDGVATDPWTAAQVDTRRSWPVGRILEEWDEFAPQCEAICHLFPDGSDVQWLADLTTHEHDIRGALGRSGGHETEAVKLSYEWLAKGFGRILDTRGLPSLRFAAQDGPEVVAGTSDVSGTMRAPAFELFRVLTGRRSLDQIAELDWQGDREASMAGFTEWGPFRPAASRISD